MICAVDPQEKISREVSRLERDLPLIQARIRIRLRFFSVLKERFRTGDARIELPSPRSCRQIFEGLIGDPDLARRLIPSVAFAINSRYVNPDAPVQDGDELALIPPVGGG